MNKTPLFFALITAAGNSSRMGGVKKELIEYEGKPLISYSVSAFLDTGLFSRIFITCGADRKKDFHSALKLFESQNIPLTLVEGGKSRQESVYRGLCAMYGYSPDYVLIHDGARPFVTEKIILDVAEGTRKYGACAPVVPVTDSLKIIRDNIIEGHPERAAFRAVQTPQGFRYPGIYESHTRALELPGEFTDDTEIYSLSGGKIFSVKGDVRNKKITYPGDIAEKGEKMAFFRTGQGYDIHRLEYGKKLVLGGVKIEYGKGAVAHSDGDVLYHAIIDALLGAAAERDIGYHFPPSDENFRDMDSAVLVAKTREIITSRGFQIENIDSTIIIEKPKISPYIEMMRKNISQLLDLDIERVSVKAKTKENCDSTGRGDSAEAAASVLISKRAAI